jgi:hypothetical protein
MRAAIVQREKDVIEFQCLDLAPNALHGEERT